MNIQRAKLLLLLPFGVLLAATSRAHAQGGWPNQVPMGMGGSVNHHVAVPAGMPGTPGAMPPGMMPPEMMGQGMMGQGGPAYAPDMAAIQAMGGYVPGMAPGGAYGMPPGMGPYGGADGQVAFAGGPMSGGMPPGAEAMMIGQMAGQGVQPASFQGCGCQECGANGGRGCRTCDSAGCDVCCGRKGLFGRRRGGGGGGGGDSMYDDSIYGDPDGGERGLSMIGGALSHLLPYGAGGWCAPRWYDAYFDYVYMARSGGVRGVGLVSDGPRDVDPPVLLLSSNDVHLDPSSGFKATFARMVGAGANIEFTYMGTLNWNGYREVTSNADLLYHVFSDFGNNPPPQAGPPIVRGGFTDTDSAERAFVGWSSSLNTFELDFRKRWTTANCRVHASWLVGARFLEVVEDLEHGTRVNYPDPNGGIVPITGSMDYGIHTTNSLTGAQLGGDMWATLVPGVRIGTEYKAALFGNRATQRTRIRADQLPGTIIEEANSAQVAYLIEMNLIGLYRLNDHLTLRGGYQLMFIDGLALAPENFNTTPPFAPGRVPGIIDDGSIFLNGVTAGIEYLW